MERIKPCPSWFYISEKILVTFFQVDKIFEWKEIKSVVRAFLHPEIALDAKSSNLRSTWGSVQFIYRVSPRLGSQRCGGSVPEVGFNFRIFSGTR